MQFEKRDLIFQTELKKKDLENELMSTQLTSKLDFIEKEAGKLSEYKDEFDKEKEKEKFLLDKLQIFLKKTEEFQKTMTDSNNYFNIFKKDFDKLNHKINGTEEDTSNLQKKSERSDTSVIDMLEEHLKAKNELKTINNQIEKLNSLSTTFEETIKQKECEIQEK